MAYKALTCNDHGFGSKKDKCVICGKWPAKSPGAICDKCGFGNRHEKCCVCEKWPAKNYAMVCSAHAGKCVICGKKA